MDNFLKEAIVITALVMAPASRAAETRGSDPRAVETRGAGSTFVTPVVAKWSAAYKARTGRSV